LAHPTDPAQAAELLSEAAALVPAIAPTRERDVALARLADAGTTLTLPAGLRPDPAWTARPVAQLLAGESWSRAAAALARLDRDAFQAVRKWVIHQLGQTLPGR
jgi:hypothetical protein